MRAALPLQVPIANSNLNSYLFQGTSFANRVPGQPLYTVDLNCHCYDPNKTFRAESERVGRSGAGPVRLFGGLLQRLPLAAPSDART